MPRLFVGLEIPREVAQALSLLRGGLPGARWIDPENYHITLRFIGDIDDRLAHEIALLLDGVKRRSFDVRFGELAAFGGRKPRAVAPGSITSSVFAFSMSTTIRSCCTASSSLC